jgi:hypothetical protein
MLFISLLRVFTKNFEWIWLTLDFNSLLKNESADVSIIFEPLQNCVIRAGLTFRSARGILSARGPLTPPPPNGL